MANKEHHAILKQGVEVWNKWREEHPEIRPNLSGANLRGELFYSANFRGVDFTETDLTNSRLFYADFISANLNNLKLEDAALAFSIFVDVDLSTVKGLETGALQP